MNADGLINNTYVLFSASLKTEVSIRLKYLKLLKIVYHWYLQIGYSPTRGLYCITARLGYSVNNGDCNITPEAELSWLRDQANIPADELIDKFNIILGGE